MKQVIYTLPYESESDIRKANAKRQRLYDKYNSVQVYPNGLHEVKIVATNKI
jgi:hypothetical protein